MKARPKPPKCPHRGPYHLTRDGLAVVRPHPQAETCLARAQGYVVLRVEPGADGAALVAVLNAGAAGLAPRASPTPRFGSWCPARR